MRGRYRSGPNKIYRANLAKYKDTTPLNECCAYHKWLDGYRGIGQSISIALTWSGLGTGAREGYSKCVSAGAGDVLYIS